ncbi:MAG: porin [Beijerinckiaceae bacterium]|nr:porin [Beijerinckiaceae bacterium]
MPDSVAPATSLKPTSPKASKDDEDEVDDDEEADPPVRNFVALRASSLQSGPCYRLSAGMASSVTLSDGTASSGRFKPDGRQSSQSEIRATIGLQSLEETEIGRVRTAFELELNRVNGETTASVSSIWASAGPLTFGLKGSNFDYWAGDEFGFKATAPSASTVLASLAFRLSESGTLTASAEAQDARWLSDSGYSKNPLPDLITRWRYEVEGTTLHLGMAFRALSLVQPTSIRRFGFAGTAAIQRDVTGFGVNDYWLAQVTYADTAPGYLGIAQPGGLLRFTLPRNLPVLLLETMKGWTAAIAYSHGWSETWRFNAFATFADLKVPEIPQRRSIQVGRAAANLVWTPVKGLDLTWELGAGRVYSIDKLFGPANYPKGPSYTAQFAISRKY